MVENLPNLIKKNINLRTVEAEQIPNGLKPKTFTQACVIILLKIKTKEKTINNKSQKEINALHIEKTILLIADFSSETTDI